MKFILIEDRETYTFPLCSPDFEFIRKLAVPTFFSYSCTYPTIALVKIILRSNSQETSEDLSPDFYILLIISFQGVL